MSIRDTLTVLSGVLCIAGGATIAIMYTDAVTARQTEASNRIEIDALHAVADDLRVKLQEQSKRVATCEASVPICPMCTVQTVTASPKPSRKRP
jgi:hypothetical protein